MIEISLGVLFALLLIWASKTWKLESWSYTVSLVFLPLIYMAFGLLSEGENIVLYEFYFGIPFFLFAVLGLIFEFKWSAYLIGVLWLSHAAYDLFHAQLFVNTGVFYWYPHFCAAVDFAISAYIFWCARQWPSAKIRLLPG
ncbi:MAG: hypothetical protein AB8B48_19090 [Pseudomonadales bacterium]